MLSINADDLGRTVEETDRALACHARGRVTSVSAMVFMEDSARAAALLRGCPVEVGLHLNLSEAFTAGGTPARVRDRHQRVCRFLNASKYALVLFNPWLMRDFEYLVKAQIAEFERLYGRSPPRIDGHQHMHLATNVLWQGLLPAGIKVRRSFSFDPGAKASLNLWYRRRVDSFLGARYRVSDRFLALSAHQELGRLAVVCQGANSLDIEMMTHPIRPGEYQLLMSDEFGELLVGTHAHEVMELCPPPQGARRSLEQA